jgi:hypothetical protein
MATAIGKVANKGSEIFGEFYHLGYNAVQSIEIQPTF